MKNIVSWIIECHEKKKKSNKSLVIQKDGVWCIFLGQNLEMS